MNWNLEGDVEAPFALLELDVLRYAQRAGKHMSANMMVGIVLSQRGEGAYNDVLEISRAQAAVHASPMEGERDKDKDGRGMYNKN